MDNFRNINEYLSFEERASRITRVILILMVVLNFFALFVALFQLYYYTEEILLAEGSYLVAIIVLSGYVFFAFIYGMGFKLSKKTKYQIPVRFVTLIMLNIQLFFLNMVMSGENQIHILFFIMPVLCFFMFPPKYALTRNLVLFLSLSQYFFWTYRKYVVINQNISVTDINFYVISIFVFFTIIVIINHFYKATHQAESQILEEYERAESLLLNVLPPKIAERLKAGEKTISDYYDEVSILFADLVGFTKLTKSVEPQKLVELLNSIFFAFDVKCNELGLEKIKTMGDGYMVMGGGLQEQDEHLKRIIELGFFMIETIKKINQKFNINLEVRIGVHLGQAIAGVIGKTKFAFDLWGETVNVASRLESTGIPMKIQITEQVRSRLGDNYAMEPLDGIELKGLGKLQTYLLSNLPK